ncbi:MAG: WYL domain-containing protein [Intestinibacter sp.]
MEMFSEFESCYYEAFTKMLCKPPMTEKEAREFIEENIDVGVDFKILSQLLSKDVSKSCVFSYDKEKKTFSPNVNIDMPIVLNKIEIEALKNLVDMEISEAFLQEETLLKLKSKLENEEKGWSIDDIKYKRQYADGDKNNIEDINKKLKILLKSIKQKCAVKCDNTTKSGEEYKQQTIYPLKIEYSTINDKYRLYCFKKDDDEKKYIKMNISGLSSLEILEDKTREEDEDFLEFNKNNIKTVTLYVDPEKHVLERCFRLFSFYNRRAIYDDEKNVYVLDINYYIYDEKEVIKNILSLGSRVIVSSPEDIREIVISRVKMAMSNYKKLCD